MKTLFIIAALIPLLLLTAGGCTREVGGDTLAGPVDNTPIGTIDGEFTADPQHPEAVANVEVALYASIDAFRDRKPMKVMVTGIAGRYVFTGLCCGQYYIDAWKDNDGNSIISRGDYYLARKNCDGVACPCVIQQGVSASWCGALEMVQ